MSLIVREAELKDIAAIQEIAKITWDETYNFLPEGQMDYMLNWMYSNESLQQQMQNGHQFFIAQLKEKSIGFASVSAEENHLFKLNKLYVLPEIQKSGAGKALLQAVIHYAKRNEGKELQLQVNRNNTAKDFYLKQGFTILYQADFEIGNGYFMNDYVMSMLF
ncbi:MAG: GNAT family N-acetyltransferase [Chitinophagaceae bacterium]|nr:GNAT family N-acetyltransferase [Chitinophagaceae bacterium]